MIEEVWGYKIKHNKNDKLSDYEKSKIKGSLFIGYKTGIVKIFSKKIEIEWSVIK